MTFAARSDREMSVHSTRVQRGVASQVSDAFRVGSSESRSRSCFILRDRVGSNPTTVRAKTDRRRAHGVQIPKFNADARVYSQYIYCIRGRTTRIVHGMSIHAVNHVRRKRFVRFYLSVIVLVTFG